jgi:hypothetical protein
MVSLALVDDHTYSAGVTWVAERPSRQEARETTVRESAGEIDRLLQRLSRVHLRAALYRLRFTGWLGYGQIAGIKERLACFGVVELLTDGSFALLDIGPAAATAEAGDAMAKLHSGVACCFGGRELGKIEIAAHGFWTDEITAEELLVPPLQ